MENNIEKKKVWTEVDFDQMNWHDVHIHAISFDAGYRFLLDIDYILQWIDPVAENAYCQFYIAPCTLVFENVSDLKIDIEVVEPFQIQIYDLNRTDPRRPINAEYIKREVEYEWIISTAQGDMAFRSIGYSQYMRTEARLYNRQRIELDQRGGISFATG